MDEIQNEIERLYSPGEVALHMDIERQTVTKYARLFEDNGYNFHKDEKGNRAYTDTNILMFKDLINQRNKPGVTLEAAAKSLAAIYKKKSVTAPVTNLPAEKDRYNGDITEKLDLQDEKLRLIVQAMQKQKESYDKLNEIVEKQNEVIESLKGYIEKSILERDKKLMSAIRETQEKHWEEQQQLLLEIAAAKEQKKGFFARLFGK